MTDMGETTGIEWTDHTFNPWIGCTKVAPGCAHCYAERDFDHRRHFAQWGPNGTRVVTSEDNWKKPLKWNRDAEAAGVRARVFCASLADVFEEWGGLVLNASGEVWTKPYLQSEWQRENWIACDIETMQRDPQGWQYVTLNDLRRELFALIDTTPWLDWQLVTKRPQNVRRMWPERRDVEYIPEAGRMNDWQMNRRDNVWLLTSISDQATAVAMIPALLECRDLVPVLGLSIEPLLGPLDLRSHLRGSCETCEGSGECMNPVCYGGVHTEDIGECPDCGGGGGKPLLDWVIVGGESGPGARPMHPQWVRDIRDQCQAASVPFFFKQHGEFLSLPETPVGTKADLWIARDGRHVTPYDGAVEWGAEPMARVGKKAAGRLLDGLEWSEYPASAVAAE